MDVKTRAEEGRGGDKSRWRWLWWGQCEWGCRSTGQMCGGVEEEKSWCGGAEGGKRRREPLRHEEGRKWSLGSTRAMRGGSVGERGRKKNE